LIKAGIAFGGASKFGMYFIGPWCDSPMGIKRKYTRPMSNASELQPLSLIEDAETGDRFVLYVRSGGTNLELRFEGDEPWATQRQMADLFGVTQQNIAYHIQEILKSGELDDVESVHKEILYTATDEKRYRTKAYGLDMILSVGHRVNSKEGVMFRRWSRQIERQYLLKGFVVDSRRLKDPGNYDRVQELRHIIAEIRSSDINYYGELRQICSFAKDYDGKSQEWQDFYKRMRAKLYWAVTSRTPSMIMAERANAELPDMGLRSWSGDQITQRDATSPVSFLSEAEFRELNSLTVILLDVFSDQADIGKLTSMKEAEELFDNQLRLLKRSVLKHGGNISSEKAEAYAKVEYKKFDAKRKAERLGIEVQAYLELKAQGKALPKAKRKKKRPS
jgi:hypothetical protein